MAVFLWCKILIRKVHILHHTKANERKHGWLDKNNQNMVTILEYEKTLLKRSLKIPLYLVKWLRVKCSFWEICKIKKLQNWVCSIAQNIRFFSSSYSFSNRFRCQNNRSEKVDIWFRDRILEIKRNLFRVFSISIMVNASTLRYLIIVQQILLIFGKSPTYMLLFHPTRLFISGKNSYLHNYLILWDDDHLTFLMKLHEIGDVFLKKST